jgi:NADP-dependent 3-hydroxy acid dehydrogenase YdfG
VFGACGSIGAAVAKEFSAEGARVFLAGRTKATLEAVAAEIAVAGGKASAMVVDALDDTGVNRYLDDVAKQAGKIAFGCALWFWPAALSRLWFANIRFADSGLTFISM